MIELTTRDFQKLADFIRGRCGIALRPEKMMMVSNRLQKELTGGGFQSFTDYVNFVTDSPSEGAVLNLINCITTNHTFFLRESDHFDFFSRHVLPELKQKCRDRDLRIWSAGCSSGEEPYTLAMLIHDFFGTEKKAWDTRILATDISTKVLQRAVTAAYSASALGNVSDRWKKEYFSSRDGEDVFQVRDNLKTDVIFRRLNLVNDVFSFQKRFDVIFCRNVFIYFEPSTKERVVDKFWDVLSPLGYLFVGHTEGLSRAHQGFRYVGPGIYQKVGNHPKP